MQANDRIAVYAALYAGLAFGIFWLPIRAVEAAGFDGPWAMTIFAALPLLICLPVAWRNRADYRWRSLRDLGGGVLSGVAFALYGAGFLYTEVVRAVLLFYAMPVWGFLLGWAVLGDRITWHRWLAIGLGLAGLVVVFGNETGLPVPRNIGDWCALAAGVAWAAAALIMLMNRRVGPLTHSVNFFAAAAAGSLMVAVLATAQGLVAPPDWQGFWPMLAWAMPVAAVLILPAGYASIFAPTRLNPGVCGLLFMAEVAVATVTASVWAGEPLSLREALGLVLILGAGLVEPLIVTWSRRRLTPLRPQDPPPT